MKCSEIYVLDMDEYRTGQSHKAQAIMYQNRASETDQMVFGFASHEHRERSGGPQPNGPGSERRNQSSDESHVMGLLARLIISDREAAKLSTPSFVEGYARGLDLMGNFDPAVPHDFSMPAVHDMWKRYASDIRIAWGTTGDALRSGLEEFDRDMKSRRAV